MLVKTTDGTPDAVKVARPVWSGGKSGDNFKGLPITISGWKLRLYLLPSAYDRRRAGFPLSGDPAGISVPGTEKRHVCAAFRISSLSGKSMAVFRSVGNGKIDSYGTLEKTV